ncbi:hypothetical protein VBR58_000818 [Citrobacter freundii]|nr:hypothetical protein [Citrobacter freundii]ELJ9990422.1 hypothetical protein [Citrobacter freundii]EMC0438033.1 hypothetical protein [Citrobacter freundii]EMD0452291.1 hypothetical protein [Citrobacter freundii]
MRVTILDEQSNDVEIIPEHFSDAEAIAAAKEAVREAALDGKTFTAVDEDGKDVLHPSFLVPVNNTDVKFNGMVTDRHGEELAEFSGIFVF